MRRRELERSEAEGLALFGRAEQAMLIHGHQVRPIHPIVFDGAGWFHGAPKGEKATWVGEQVTLEAHEVICRIPSHWRHPERACPATTYYRSAQVEGTLVAEVEGARKAAVLQAMMERYQPEGSHRPITAHDPLYAAAVRGLSVVRVEGVLRARAKLGENLDQAAFHRVLQGLWGRGGPGDDAAIEALLAESRHPVPPFLCGPHKTRLLARLPEAQIPEAVALVRDAYWNARWDDATIADAMRGSRILVGIESDGLLVATARAFGDGSKMVYLGDVAVHPGWRGRGLGHALVRHLLSHGAARTRWACLHTRPSTLRFYEPLGFTLRGTSPDGERVELVRFAPPDGQVQTR